METGKRTILKAILWNALGLTVMAMVGFAMTGSLMMGGSMAVINSAIGFATYVIYERLWSRIAWGRTDG